jgi:hypothetical protein
MAAKALALKPVDRPLFLKSLHADHHSWSLLMFDDVHALSFRFHW